MVSLGFLSLAFSAVCGLVSAADQAAPIAVRDTAAGSPGFLNLPLYRREVPPATGIQRRSSDVATAANLSDLTYLIELDIGTPPQTVALVIDTGSSLLWVNPNCSSGLSDELLAVCYDSMYFPSRSTTARDGGGKVRQNYGLGDVYLNYVYDTISVPGSDNYTVTDVKFGVAYASDDMSTGILGIGFGNGTENGGTNVSTLLQELVAQGVTTTQAFSLVLGTSNTTVDEVGADMSDGTIIFSGVDTKKFKGPLVAQDNLEPQNGEDMWRYWVQMDAITYTDRVKNTTVKMSNSSLPVILDSGSTISSLPEQLVEEMIAAMKVDTETDDGVTGLYCNATNANVTFDFHFGAVSVSVPLSDFVRPVEQDVCELGVEISNSIAILGDSFLRSAYVLFDQDNLKIYMAEAADCGSDVQSLPNTTTTYNFTGQCNQSNTERVQEGSTSTSSSATALSASLTTALLVFVGLQMFMVML